jgi:hypothetical protein
MSNIIALNDLYHFKLKLVYRNVVVRNLKRIEITNEFNKEIASLNISKQNIKEKLFVLDFHHKKITLQGNNYLNFDIIDTEKEEYWRFINPIKCIATSDKSYYEHKNLKVRLSPNGFGLMLSCNSNFIGRIRTTEIDVKNDTFADLILAICCVNSIRNYVYKVNESNG